MEMNEIKDFELNPILRQLLKDYCEMVYEESSITDDYHLLMEYRLLQRENRLADLFKCEQLNNSFNQMDV